MSIFSLLIFILFAIIFVTISVCILLGFYGFSSPENVALAFDRLKSEATLFQNCLELPCAENLVCDPTTKTCKYSNDTECDNYNQCLTNSVCLGICTEN